MWAAQHVWCQRQGEEEEEEHSVSQRRHPTLFSAPPAASGRVNPRTRSEALAADKFGVGIG
eukprot:7551360-Pyramimonas_sp.AAC.1